MCFVRQLFYKSLPRLELGTHVILVFMKYTTEISESKRSVKITDRFPSTSANVIYCITCTLCNKLYIGEAGRRLGDRLREHLRDVEKNDRDSSKPVARHFNLPNHSKKHMAICGLSLHQGTTESRKNLEQKFTPQRYLQLTLKVHRGYYTAARRYEFYFEW